MKLMKIFSAVMVATTMGAAVTVATPSMTADAKAKKSLKTLPKSLRRTWYHYEKNDKGKLVYSKLKISAKKIVDSWNGWDTSKVHTTKSNLHQYNPAKKLQKGKDSWIFAYKSGAKTRFGGWSPEFPKDMTYKRAREQYKVVTDKVNGKKVKVLHHTNLASLPQNTAYYYTSKKLAKLTNPQGHNYGDNYGIK
ncbi:hypothetical protein [Levilactobacillus suantsaiihabitans]|uniref:D-alanyl-D-alanine carboxypeptidase n=1 Tax=Levilactobacillus suantsaiihabitans TaxID=2487722 RepID=A0A4Z0JD34_9LACO|nr:hypothetical protein [Levilactobacillus suantsaiihabitans]TGD19540.1 hypothetical protein EGT51_03285 [Levilactobacillus suantsaiihabitans]